MFLNEGSKFSQRKFWSFIGAIIFLGYAFYILFTKDVSDIPTNITMIIGIIVGFYFARRVLDKHKENKDDPIRK